MNFRRYISLTAAALLLTGCSAVPRAEVSESSDISIDELAPTEAPQAEETTEPAESYPDYPVSFPAIEEQDTGDIYEAELCELGSGLSVSTDRENFSGDGYVTGFTVGDTDYIEFAADVPSNQHYDLSFCIASDSQAECTVYLNDTEISRFDTTDDGAFTKITLYGVFLVEGESVIRLSTDGDMCLDSLKVSNNTTLSEISYEADGELSNINAGESAKELMSFLTESYGEYVITGQHVSDETDKELDIVYSTTGKYPVIRFSALENFNDSFDDTFKTVDAAAEWHRKGGIVGLMWHWESPGAEPSVYAEQTDFSLSDAVTDEDIALLTQEEIRGLYGEGRISEQCYGLILDIDNMSGQLLSLKNKGIPVLWRPLHEGSGDWFWWGASGAEDYKWLWELMYTRMTEYFGLDNLIWVWNGQSEDTLVDEDMYDIAAVDIYMGEDKEYGSRYEQFAALQKIIGAEKLIALSECSSVPDIDASFRDNAVWSFFGLWYGDYLQTESGEFSDRFITEEEFIRAYNSSGAITLDEYTKMKEAPSEEETTEEKATLE